MEESARELPSSDVAQSVPERIAAALGENDELPKSQIRELANVFGDDKMLELLSETQRVEQAGGMLVPDGSRRRTPGGVFFYLARGQLSRADRRRIFGPPAEARQKKPDASESPQSSGPKSSLQRRPQPLEANHRTRPIEPVESRRSGIVTVTNGARQRRIVEVETVRRRIVPAAMNGGAPQVQPEGLDRQPNLPGVTNGSPVPSSNGSPPQRVRRIVTIADMRGKAEEPEAPARSEQPLHRIPPGVSFDPKSVRRRVPAPVAESPEERVREALVGCAPQERPRVLLGILLEELENLPTAREAARLSDRVVAVAAAKLKIPVSAIARALFGEDTRQSRGQVESLVEEGVELATLERLYPLIQEKAQG